MASNNNKASEEEGNVKRKSRKVGYSIDDIFTQMSSIRSSTLVLPVTSQVNNNSTNSNIGGYIGDIALTPRSYRVCESMGINPEVLRIRDISSFADDRIDESNSKERGDLVMEVARIRHEAYVQRRHDVMRKCTAERKKIIQEESSKSLALVVTDGKVKTAAQRILEQEAEKNSEMIRMEMIKLQKMKERQEKEIENMVKFEMKQAEIQREMTRKMEEEKRREQMEKKAYEKRFKAMMEERRMKDMHRAMLDEIEEQNRRQKALEMSELDQRLERERQEKLLQIKLQLQAETQRKFEEHEAQKQKLQQYFADEQMKIRQKMNDIHQAEERKKEAQAIRHKKQMEENQWKRFMSMKRIEKNRQTAKQTEEQRKQEILHKQQVYEEKRAMTLAQEAEERQLQAAALEFKEYRRQQILQERQEAEQEEINRLLERLDQEEVMVMQTMQARMRELEINKEKRNVRNQLKEDNKMRVMRMKEKHRQDILNKIEEADSRIKAIVTERERLVEQRRRTAADSRLQKEKVLKMMDTMRSKATLSLTNGNDFDIDNESDDDQQQQRQRQQQHRSLSASSPNRSSSGNRLPALRNSATTTPPLLSLEN